MLRPSCSPVAARSSPGIQPGLCLVHSEVLGTSLSPAFGIHCQVPYTSPVHASDSVKALRAVCNVHPCLEGVSCLCQACPYGNHTLWVLSGFRTPTINFKAFKL